MGLLDRLRGGKDTTITMTVEPAEVGPGDEITVRYEVAGELDAKARAVRVDLDGTASYKAQVTRTYGSADDSNVSTTEEWQSYSLHHDEHVLPLRTGPGEVRFVIPGDARPSSSQVVSWSASARIDRERGMDKVERSEVVVRHGAEAVPTSRAPQRHEDGLTLDEVPVAVRAGEPVTGLLTVGVAKDVTVTAVRIRLHRKVTYTAAPMTDGSLYGGDSLPIFSFGSGTISTDLKVAEVDLAGKREFSAGSVERLPFSVTVPAGAGPTTAHAYGRVEWRVEAVLDRRVRGDLAVETPLVVL